ncbi:MAG: S-layer homology domain-containing protein, partial [Actinomycetota bacterium]
RRRRAGLLACAFFAVAALAATSLVVTLARSADANHRFNDVATGTFFHDSTAWLKDNGIADGFPDGSFRSGDNINRGQASYWFSNYNESIELVRTSEDPPGGINFQRTTGCPAGKRAVAGGGTVDVIDVHMTDSQPSPSVGVATG